VVEIKKLIKEKAGLQMTPAGELSKLSDISDERDCILSPISYASFQRADYAAYDLA
jgi:hypothetical protein